MRTLALALLAALIGFAAPALAQSRLTERDSRVTRFERAPGGVLRIVDPHAKVTVRFVDRPGAETQVQVILASTDTASFEAMTVVNDSTEDGLSIRVDGPAEGRGTMWRVELIDVTVAMPNRVEIEGGAGDVELYGFNPANPGPSPRRVEPPVFGLWIKAQNPSTIETTSGSITVGRSRGPFVLRSTRGDVTADYHRGPIDIQTDSGEVVATGLVAPFGVWSNRGDVDISLIEAPAGGVRAVTTRGEIKIDPSVPVLDANTPLGRADGEIVCVVTTATGDIEIRRAGAP